LLKRDDFQADEIDSWDCLIKWGIEQTPGLGSKNSDRAKWNQENFEALKETLSQFIPLIRFVEISFADFLDKVHPYKAVIPKRIYEELEKFYYKDTSPKTMILPPRISKLISTIIKPELTNIIANWIDKNDSNVLSFNNRYKFNLIYLKSRDGLNISTFNQKCNGQGPFVVLVKVQSKKIYGGYNPIGYALRDGEWLTSSDSFTFSFENNQDMQDMKIRRIINPTKSIWENCNWVFFNFGEHFYLGKQDFYEHNLEFLVDCYYKYNNFVFVTSLPIKEIEEIEVFSVLEK